MAHTQIPEDYDVESLGQDSTESGVLTEWVGCTMSPAKAEHWERVVGTKPSGPRGHYHPHALLAAQRYVCEKFACRQLLANEGAIVVDVGAAPCRTYVHLQDRGRYLMPQLHPGDGSRRGRVPPLAMPHVCPHTFEECTCYALVKRAYLFTHSAYYIDPLALWQTLNDDNVLDALVVEHVFDDVFGGFYSEASWHVEKDTVTMTVSGNGAPYRHKLPAWQMGWRGENGEAFEYEVLKVLDDVTRVIRLVPVQTVAPSAERLTWDEVTANPQRSGPVQFSQASRNAIADDARFTQVTFDVEKVWKFGPVLYTDVIFKGHEVSITIPVNGVAMVAAHCVNRERTPELYTEVTFVLKQRWGRARIPPAKYAQTIAATIALGFVCNLANEIDLTHTILHRFSWRMKLHSTLLRFGDGVVRKWYWLIPFVLLWTTAMVLSETFDKDTTQRVVIFLMFLVLTASCSACCFGCVRVARYVQVYRQANWVSSITDPDGPRAPLLGQGFQISRGLTIPGSRFVKPSPQIPYEQGDVSVGATRERVFEPNRSIISGIVTDGAIPTVLHATQEAELCAVTNRILQPRENPAPEALEKYERVFWQRPEFTNVKRGIDTSYGFFRKWLKKLGETYPATYVRNMEETWKQNQGVQAEPVPTKGFPKIEKSAAAVVVDEAKATKTRLVQPPEDVDKAMTGPTIWQLYEHVKDAWDGVKCGVMYCSGYSTARIGAAVDKFEEEHQQSGVVAWSVDMGGYDATLGLQLQTPVFGWYVFLGMVKWMISWIMRIRSRGRTPNAVTYFPRRVYQFKTEKEALVVAEEYRKYKLKCYGPRKSKDIAGDDVWIVEVEDFQMTSGRMDTNLTDTVALVAAILSGLPQVPFLLLACGDDGFLMLRKSDEPLIQELVVHLRALGLKPEGVVSSNRAQWEFCSKLFWYGVDPSSGKEQTVLGSKPFRGISRMGMNTTLPGAANAAQAALSVRKDAGHVPFLAPFADRTHQLCKEHKLRPTGKAEWSSMHADRRYNCSVKNYVLCQERYGLGKEQEDEFIERLSCLNSIPVVLQWLPLVDAVRVDQV